MKVVINSCFGGFGLSPEATLELYKRGGPVDATPVSEYYKASDTDSLFGKAGALKKWREYKAGKRERREVFLTVFSDDESLVLNARDAERHNPILCALVEEMGDAASGSNAKLRVVEIPDGTDYEIAAYDGIEHIAERHRTWS